MSDPTEPVNELKEAARRYDSDEKFRRMVDGDKARDLTDEDIDFDVLPPLEA